MTAEACTHGRQILLWIGDTEHFGGQWTCEDCGAPMDAAHPDRVDSGAQR